MASIAATSAALRTGLPRREAGRELREQRLLLHLTKHSGFVDVAIGKDLVDRRVQPRRLFGIERAIFRLLAAPFEHADRTPRIAQWIPEIAEQRTEDLDLAFEAVPRFGRGFGVLLRAFGRTTEHFVEHATNRD